MEVGREICDWARTEIRGLLRSLPVLVVIISTPLAPLVPNTAVAVASFNDKIDVCLLSDFLKCFGQCDLLVFKGNILSRGDTCEKDKCC